MGIYYSDKIHGVKCVRLDSELFNIIQFNMDSQGLNKVRKLYNALNEIQKKNSCLYIYRECSSTLEPDDPSMFYIWVLIDQISFENILKSNTETPHKT